MTAEPEAVVGTFLSSLGPTDEDVYRAYDELSSWRDYFDPGPLLKGA